MQTISVLLFRLQESGLGNSFRKALETEKKYAGIIFTSVSGNLEPENEIFHKFFFKLFLMLFRII